ncbi:DUF2339 domain-containing protein [Sphingomonas sp. S1-29]|uniref:DUF2339 domain-containing protein n=1 Tax=Sphingomonas sp. S1-29 TaxID=2991074 RepID=UPI00224077C2|nr:DUF2339 domain-containing protein [Sphingomonas sp. S1-29]UZK68083.1 DUF2339 domain-containing protein [Sphingomonas sp. S1-29]
MDGIFLIVLLILGGLLFDARRRIAALERALGSGEVSAPVVDRALRSPPAAPRSMPKVPRPRIAIPDVETLIGGKLPVWIGGIALVLAGFFLVRAAIDTGLLGPGVRAALAAVFAVVLVAASEAARRFGPTRDDPRISQVLSGAGIASAYGTLYLAAASYQLIDPLPAFGVMVAITGIALALAVRHGPPTAVMALAGGFAAPLVAGYDAAGLGALLVYLGLFVGALFGLGINRGWTWLTIAAALAGFGWANFLGLALGDGDVAAVGLFVVVLAIATTLALPPGARAWLRVAPLAAGLLQLLVFAPTLDFGPFAWGCHLVLAGAALILAWRDERLLPAPAVAAVLTLVLLGMGADRVAGLAAIVATAMFAGAGLARSRRHAMWAMTALLGLLGPVLVLHAATPALLPSALWALIELAAAGAAGWLSWRHRDRTSGRDVGLVGGALGTVLAGVTGIAALAGSETLALLLAAAMAGLYFWTRKTRADALAITPALPFAAAIAAAVVPIGQLLIAAVSSIGGDTLPYRELPAIGVLLRDLMPAMLVAAALLVDPAALARARRPMAGLAAAGIVAILYTLAKQPLAIATEPAFVGWGFTERALITQAMLVTGWLIARTRRAPRLGDALLLLALFRIAWFDLILLNPVVVRQAVGAAAVLHAALAAGLLWTWPAQRPAIRIAALAMTLVAALAVVRQAAHGSLLTGPVGTPENWGYSAAMLLVSIAWLWRGITGGARDQRFAGLGLVLIVSLKVFTIDIALEGLLRVVSFLGIGVTLIAIGWVYTRFLARAAPVTPNDTAPPADPAPA